MYLHMYYSLRQSTYVCIDALLCLLYGKPNGAKSQTTEEQMDYIPEYSKRVLKIPVKYIQYSNLIQQNEGTGPSPAG